jgi:hypothetical protein
MVHTIDYPEYSPISHAVAAAINNAALAYTHKTNIYDQMATDFKEWIWVTYGITVYVNFESMYNAEGDTWQLLSYMDDEKLVMFKLEFG